MQYPKSGVEVRTVLGSNGKLGVIGASSPLHLYRSVQSP